MRLREIDVRRPVVFGARFSGTRGSRNGDALRFLFESAEGQFRDPWHSLIEEEDDAGRWKTFAEEDRRPRPPAASS